MKNNNKDDVVFNLDRIKEIYLDMCSANIEEVRISIEGINFRIKRFGEKKDTNEIIKNIPNISRVNILESKEAKQEEKIAAEEIVSPINGIFYRSPSPGAPPYVNEGDIVAAGSVLCVIEAMKVMNEIKAEKKCKIVKILCENGSNVSIGTKLFIVEPV